MAPLESRAVLCTALGGPELRQQLPAIVEQARDGSVPLQWLAPALDTPETRLAFEQWIAARAAAVRHEAATRQRALEADLARQQAAAPTPARPSAGSRWQARLEQRWATLRNDATTGWRRWLPELMMLGTTLLLFGFGRLLRRAGCPMPLMLGVSVVLTGVLTFAVMKWVAGPNPTAGEGWQRGSVAAFGVMVASIYVLGGLLALHALHMLLDDDKVSWLDTVIRGWRGITNWSGQASRGEFWGFVAHVALLWAAARVALHPAEQVVALVAAPALGALLWRRMWTMSWVEKGAVAGSLGFVILEILFGALL